MSRFRKVSQIAIAQVGLESLLDRPQGVFETLNTSYHLNVLNKALTVRSQTGRAKRLVHPVRSRVGEAKTPGCQLKL